MKKIFNYILLPMLFVSIVSCDNGFDELNTSKVNTTEIDPILHLNFAAMNASFYTGNAGGTPLIYDAAIVQHLVTPNSGVTGGGNSQEDNRDVTMLIWQNYYRNVIRNTRDVIRLTKDRPDRKNLYNMARIFQAYGFMILTDEYGNIPYTEAGYAFSDELFYPKYDTQEFIYTDIINELTEASAALDASTAPEAIDLFFGGSIPKWKKFGYSLLLRAGMRLSKVNPTLAASTVQAAFAGGVITANADNAVIKHDANNVSGLGNTLNGAEGANFYLTEYFVNFLKNSGDPRLTAIAVRYKDAKSGNDQKVEVATKAPADQIGMPMGYNNSTIVPIATGLGLASFYDFSQVDRRRMAKRDAPMFLVTAAQTQLLLAEARQRNWITAGTVEEYYNAGVRAHMEQLASYDAGSAVPDAAITTYLTNNPLGAGTELEQINEQYWVASFLNAPEAFANLRRSGYPVLPTFTHPRKSIAGDAIKRITYPNSELSVNTENSSIAIENMRALNGGGGDDLETRVWWDRP